jgi:hypothetical protein
MTERFIQGGKLTPEGFHLGGKMVNMDCERRPCAFCSHRNPSTLGPGGPGCPAEGETIERVDVDQILTIYLGRSPGHEALGALRRIR